MPRTTLGLQYVNQLLEVLRHQWHLLQLLQEEWNDRTTKSPPSQGCPRQHAPLGLRAPPPHHQSWDSPRRWRRSRHQIRAYLRTLWCPRPFVPQHLTHSLRTQALSQKKLRLTVERTTTLTSNATTSSSCQRVRAVCLKARLCMCDRLIPKYFTTCPVTFMSFAFGYRVQTVEYVNWMWKINTIFTSMPITPLHPCWNTSICDQWLTLNSITPSIPSHPISTSIYISPLPTAHDVSARVGSKRKAENRTSPTTPITPTKTKLKARTSQSAASAYALSYQSNTFSVSYPTVQTFENTFTSYCPSYSGQTAFPINSTHTQLSDYTNCAASVPADCHTHEYYCVEDETTFLTTPSYAQYDDDHICYGLKLPEDPYILELSQGDYGDFQIQDSYKYQSLGKEGGSIISQILSLLWFSDDARCLSNILSITSCFIITYNISAHLAFSLYFIFIDIYWRHSLSYPILHAIDWLYPAKVTRRALGVVSPLFAAEEGREWRRLFTPFDAEDWVVLSSHSIFLAMSHH